MKFSLDKARYYKSLNRRLNHKWLIITFVCLITVFTLAACAIAYCHDTYYSLFPPINLAKMDVWCRICLSLLVLTVILFILWPIGSVVLSLLDSLSISRNDRNVQKGGLSINNNKLRSLFSPSFTDDKYLLFCSRLEEKTSKYRSRDYGRLALYIMEHTKYSSEEDKYKRTIGVDKIGNFTPYIKDFFEAIGRIPSSTDKGYYDYNLDEMKKDFQDIFDS